MPPFGISRVVSRGPLAGVSRVPGRLSLLTISHRRHTHPLAASYVPVGYFSRAPGCDSTRHPAPPPTGLRDV